MTTASKTEIKVPFKKLALDPKNVRKLYGQAGIQTLADNVAIHGVLQNLIVRKAAKRGHFLVSAGGRRFRAVELLISQGLLTQDYEINCQVRSEDEATELSLVENVMREAMDPADQFRAFKTLADEGRNTEEIAKSFGTTSLVVAKRLKLARVSPVLFALYEKGEMDLSQLQAFTVSDDHEAQERVWDSLPQFYRGGRDIRTALSDGKIPASDKRVKFIGGLEAVRKAGGTVICDLFTDDDGGYVEDVALVESLIAKKVDAASIEISVEGWKWVRYQQDLDYSDLQAYGREYPAQPDISKEDQAEIDRLEIEGDEAAERFNQTDDESDRAAFEIADQSIEALKAKYVPAYTEEQKADCGVLMSIGYDGVLRVERGMVGPSDLKAKTVACDGPEGETKEAGNLSKALVAELTARKTATLRVALAKNPDVALAVAVHAMALTTLYNRTSAWSHGGGVEVTLDSPCLETHIKDAGQCEDLTLIERQRESWKSVLPLDPADLWAWCLELSREGLLELQAFLVAQTLNAVDHGEGYNKTGAEHGNRIGAVLGVSMADHFQPTAANFFSRVKLDVIHESLVEACGEDVAAPVLKMKKKEAAVYAERKVEGTGWLPEVMTLTDQPVDELSSHGDDIEVAA